MTNRTKGIIAIISSAFGFALMAMFVRLCDDYGNEIETANHAMMKFSFESNIEFPSGSIIRKNV